MDIQPVGFVDVSQIAAFLVARHSAHFSDDTRRQDEPGSPYRDTQAIMLRGPEGISEARGQAAVALWAADVPHHDAPLLSSWPSARQAIAAIAARLEPHFGTVEYGKILVESLRPGGVIDWHAEAGEYAERHLRFHVCLVPSPGAMIYAGVEHASLPVGMLTVVNHLTVHSAVNLGPVARVHLVLDVRQAQTA